MITDDFGDHKAFYKQKKVAEADQVMRCADTIK
jgi:hypothetical protein